MPFLIDTNIAIHAVEGFGRVLDKLAENEGMVVLSALSAAELWRGVYKRPAHSPLRRIRLATLLDAIPVLPFDAAAAEAYGQIIAEVGWVRGRDFDRMIAGHAIARGATLVTANVADFRDIPNLVWENWAAGG